MKNKKAKKNRSELYLSAFKRREFLRRSVGGMAGAWLTSWPWQKIAAQQDLNPVADDWDSGVVRHLLPAVNESHILIKASFSQAQRETPRLQIQNGNNTRFVEGYLNDTRGEFWQFYATELQSDTQYELSLQDSNGRALCESWPLSTFPAPQQNPEKVRVLFYTLSLIHI